MFYDDNIKMLAWLVKNFEIVLQNWLLNVKKQIINSLKILYC